MSNEAKAEKSARETVRDAIKLLRKGQGILQLAEWEHDPFAAVIDEAKNLYDSLQGYTVDA